MNPPPGSARPGPQLRHGLSFDVEEAFHALNLWGAVPPESWAAQAPRSEEIVARILALLAEHRVRATFFVLGLVAERSPGVVRAIASAGHELASHGYSHRMAGDLGPAAFDQDVRRARGLLQDLSGLPVEGFRASTFSIGRGTRWALPILARAGHSWDSSVFPVRHDRYGDTAFPHHAVHLTLRDAPPLREYPLLTRPALGRRWPAAGGGYLRLLPLSLVDGALRRSAADGEPGIVYLHPWELDPGQPRHKLGGLRTLRHYHGIERVEARLVRLMRRHAFGAIGEIRVPETRVVELETLPE
ncbi:MAG TPA: XrtA system polysaccharide deacetylase [Planctomycetota bacterium]|nr:XrtA system polysaccharide deacetylase [Planctomycetota bacterium]